MSSKIFLSKDKEARYKKDHLDRITRIVALVIAFISVFIFFFKLLFF